MSKSTNQGSEGIKMYSLHELAALMLKDQRIHEGLYELSVEIQIAVGAVGPDADNVLPGAVLGVKSAGLRKVEQANPLSVDAEKVNPAPKTAAKKASPPKGV